MGFIFDDDMVRGSPLPGWSGRFFHSANMTFARWTIEAGAADLHEHLHEHAEEVWNVVSGEIVLSVGGTEQLLSAGDAAVVAPGTPHSVHVRSAAEVIVTDFPRRDDLPGV